MLGKMPRMNPLESRKQLLIVESEINRAYLLQEWQTLAEGGRDLAHRAKSFGTLILSIMPWVVGLAALRRANPPPVTSKSSWFQKVVSGVRLAFKLWLMMRSRGSEAGKK